MPDARAAGLVSRLVGALPRAVVEEVTVGLFSTAVLSRGPDGTLSCGLASTLRPARCGGAVPQAGSLRGREVREVAGWLAEGARGPLASVAMAALNSALAPAQAEEINASELLAQKGAGKTVALIGHFPFAEKLRASAGKLLVFEQAPAAPEDIPAERIPELLPQAEVVGLTALTLLNGTFDSVLACCAPSSFRLLLGPSAPLSPLVLDCGIDAVAGARVHDIPALLEALRQGSNFRSLPGKRLLALRKGA